MPHPRLAAVVAAVALPTLAACTENAGSAAPGGDSRTVSVTSDDATCRLSAAKAPAGKVVFRLKNAGTQVTEFYLYAADGSRVVGEVENVGPGLSRDLVVDLAAGTYVPACKPGMTGTGIRSTFRVTGSSTAQDTSDAASQRQMQAATARYARFVQGQSAQLLVGTRRFLAAYVSGDDALARVLYPQVRTHWERIEPVAESFGDLDPKMDARQADLEQGQRWTGWHRIEKDLWPPEDADHTPLTRRQRASYANGLLADTRTLNGRVAKLSFSVDQIANGASSLLDEVATRKVTGEEEVFSHTDLYDFQANVDGARVAFEGLLPALSAKDPVLAQQIKQRFTALQTILDHYRSGRRGFVGYDTLGKPQVKQLSDAVNALSEPLSKLTAAVTL